MKKAFLIMASLMFFTTFAFAGGDQNQNRYDGEIGQGPTQQQRITDPNAVALQAMQLTEDQKATIYSVYEEEKVARDVYMTLGDLYPDENTFANIQLSEQIHMDAVRNLCVKYGIDIPTVDEEVGSFELAAMETLYTDFVGQGGASLLAALQVGEAIELMDIKDLTDAQVGMPKDVKRVLTNLIFGSTNHLEAFQNAIDRVTAQ